MLVPFLRIMLILGVGGFWDDPESWVFLVPVLSGVEKNWDILPIFAETPPAFLVDCWIFVCPGEPLSSTLLVMVSKCFYGSRTENWKQNRSFLMRASSWVVSILQPKRENVTPDGLSYRIPDASFISFPEALWNAEVERLSTINALFITFVNLFFCILQCIVCVHWELMIHECYQI